MARLTNRKQPAHAPAAIDLDAELDGIAAMSIDELRPRWRERRGNEPPAALSKDLLARGLAHWLQEDVFGGLDARLRKLLSTAATGDSLPVRRVKVGSVVVREYQGKLHEVLVVPEGFCWQRQTYASLSAIARKITGTSWNGPRFFGLRGTEEPSAPEVVARPRPTSDARAALGSGSVKARSPVRNHGGAS